MSIEVMEQILNIKGWDYHTGDRFQKDFKKMKNQQILETKRDN